MGFGLALPRRLWSVPRPLFPYRMTIRCPRVSSLLRIKTILLVDESYSWPPPLRYPLRCGSRLLFRARLHREMGIPPCFSCLLQYKQNCTTLSGNVKRQPRVIFQQGIVTDLSLISLNWSGQILRRVLMSSDSEEDETLFTHTLRLVSVGL